MIADTATRVQKHTAPHINSRIQWEIQKHVSKFEGSANADAITGRLDELDREWDTERALQTNFAIFSILGLVLANTAGRRWLGLALGVPAFMIQHSLQGWCPPLPVMRRLGLRTSKEINDERFALKSLRGDFREAARSGSAEEIIRAVRA